MLTVGCAEGYARDATEIQNIQIAEGDVCHGLPIPIYMVFPRLFTCPTLETTNFKVGKLALFMWSGDGPRLYYIYILSKATYICATYNVYTFYILTDGTLHIRSN